MDLKRNIYVGRWYFLYWLDYFKDLVILVEHPLLRIFVYLSIYWLSFCWRTQTDFAARVPWTGKWSVCRDAGGVAIVPTQLSFGGVICLRLPLPPLPDSSPECVGGHRQATFAFSCRSSISIQNNKGTCCLTCCLSLRMPHHTHTTYLYFPRDTFRIFLAISVSYF